MARKSDAAASPRSCAPDGRLKPAAAIRFAEIDGLIVIFDLVTEDYFVLNSTGSLFWKDILAAGGDAQAAAAAAAASFASVDPSHIRADLTKAVEDWRRRGFLSAGPDSQPAQRARPFSASRWGVHACAFWSLAATAWSLRRKGFAFAYQSCANLPAPSAAADDTLAARAESAFLRVENLFHFTNAPQDCLPRSLALFRFCRSIGLPVRHCIGGRRFPQLAMHAWVELGDRVLLDSSDCREKFTCIAAIPPWPTFAEGARSSHDDAAAPR